MGCSMFEFMVAHAVNYSSFSMESQQHIRFCLCHNVPILLILFMVVGMEMGRCEPNSASNKSNSNAICSSKKYLMTSFFEKYDLLVDSNFQDFIAHELKYGSCEMLPDNQNFAIRQSVLERHLIGEGSHRLLSSSIRFHFDPESLSQLPINYCEVIVVERLPSGVFADPFELQHLHRRGVFAEVAVFGDTNLELPSFRSNQSVVEVHLNIASNIFLSQKNGLEIEVQLPLHARYQPLDESGYSRVEFDDPDLFMRCYIKGKPQNQSCLFISTADHSEPETGAVVWRIPSGIKAHTEIVSGVTFISAFLSTLSIVLASLFCSNIKPSKSLKQS